MITVLATLKALPGKENELNARTAYFQDASNKFKDLIAGPLQVKFLEEL